MAASSTVALTKVRALAAGVGARREIDPLANLPCGHGRGTSLCLRKGDGCGDGG